MSHEPAAWSITVTTDGGKRTFISESIQELALQYASIFGPYIEDCPNFEAVIKEYNGEHIEMIDQLICIDKKFIYPGFTVIPVDYDGDLEEDYS